MPAEDDTNEIRQLEERLRVAMLTSNVAELDVLIDDRLLFIGPDAGVYRKEDDLELHRSGTERLSRVDFEEIQVEKHGPIAITVVVANLAGEFKGEAFAGYCRYVRTWMLGDDGWKIIAGSVHLVPE